MTMFVTLFKLNVRNVFNTSQSVVVTFPLTHVHFLYILTSLLEVNQVPDLGSTSPKTI